MTHLGAMMFTDVTGELVDDDMLNLLSGRVGRGRQSDKDDLAHADPRGARKGVAGALVGQCAEFSAWLVAAND